jgi:PKHD-type hydroxylase
MLLCLPDLLSAEERDTLCALALAAPWAAGESAGEQARLAKRNLQIPADAPALREMRALVMRALNRSPDFIAAALPNKLLPPNFNRYEPDHPEYGWHTDRTLRWLPDGAPLRTDVSATLFLSDPADYDGGELEVQDTYGSQRVKLPAGHLVLYPSGSLHRVTPVTRGQRLACYLFLQSLVKDAGQRRLLWEMDQALRALRGRIGDADADLVRLTGTYNNLLRLWAEG